MLSAEKKSFIPSNGFALKESSIFNLHFTVDNLEFQVMLSNNHYEPEWEFWLGFWLRGNTTHIRDFCIPLDFLGIKDLKKNLKRPKKISKAITKATAPFIEIL